jgi:hypothetical protein
MFRENAPADVADIAATGLCSANIAYRSENETDFVGRFTRGVNAYIPAQAMR